MLSALDTLTKFVNSPGGVLTAGAVLAGFVWKFFERVEAVLTDQTKFEIAVWLLGIRLKPTLQSWPDTCLVLVNRVFGPKHFSIKCVWRSFLASTCVGFGWMLMVSYYPFSVRGVREAFESIVRVNFFNVIPDYISLLETRLILRFIQRHRSRANSFAFVILDMVFTITTGLIAGYIYMRYTDNLSWPFSDVLLIVTDVWLIMTSLATSVWLWLYFVAAWLLIVARKVDFGFDWFNRKFDIEKKPLQSIGLVAGAIVAVVYWAAAGLSRLL